MMNNDRSVDLEYGEYLTDLNLVVEDAIKAVAETGDGYFVNLVTPSSFGNPIDYLSKPLEKEFGKSIDYKLIDQCG